MANENVKISILEDDATLPKGSGASSDVVYVPGMTINNLEGVDRYPVQCDTLDDFVTRFGDKPQDILVEEGGSYRLIPDKSYIYASELLNAGLSVVYHPILTTADLQKGFRDHAAIESVDDTTITVQPFDPESGKGYKAIWTENTETGYFELPFHLVPFASVSANTLKKCARLNYVATTDSFKQLDVAYIVDVEVNESNDYIVSKTKNSIEYKEGTSGDAPVEVLGTVTVRVKGDNINVDDLTNILVEVKVTVEGYHPKMIRDFYNGVSDKIDLLKDKNEYSVKYITLGGYPSVGSTYFSTHFDGEKVIPGYTEYAAKLKDIAKDRGDAVALIDHEDDVDAKLKHTESTSIYNLLENNNSVGTIDWSFATMFTPWGDYNCPTRDTDAVQLMPASFGYLLCVASAIKTKPNWLAMAGVTRGRVPNLIKLHTNEVLTNTIAENYQPKFGTSGNSLSINAITNIKPYGLTIWGNRTLFRVPAKGTQATNFLNTRNMVSDIKKLAYSTAKDLMFEQDSDTLWLRFKSGVSPLLDQLKSGNGISDYKIIRGTTKYGGKPLTRGELAAVIKIFPKAAIEYFEITVQLADNDVTVA